MKGLRKMQDMASLTSSSANPEEEAKKINTFKQKKYMHKRQLK
jgi:hypothetical protein